MAEIQIKEDYQKKIITAITNEDDIVFVIYAAIDNTEEKFKFALAKILEKYNKEDIFTPVLSCIKELIANSTKAIAKKILIEEGIIKNPDNVEDVVKQVRSVLNEKALLEYGLKAKEKRMSTRIYFKVQNFNLIIQVISNVPLTQKEQKKISEKIRQSSKYDNIAEFYMENPDPEAEGMGLGISMVVVLLNNLNISYKNFLVTSDKKHKTYAQIRIPLK